MKIGFIGLGTMGAFMAANLQKSQHRLVVNDARKGAAESHIGAGAEWADTPRAVAEQCDVVFTSLPGPLEVEAVVFGQGGLLEGAHPGMAYFDLSTNSQALMRRVHAAMAERGAQAFDAPVSGGPVGAETGKLAIWVGGDRATYEKHKRVLDAMGDQAAYIGPIGSATVAKLVHNLAGYAIQTVMAEVFSMGVKAGADPLRVVEDGAPGGARAAAHLRPHGRPVPGGPLRPAAFALKLAHKDVTLAVGLGREVGVPMRLCNLVMEEMNEAMGREGWATRDSRITDEDADGARGRGDPLRPGGGQGGAGRGRGAVARRRGETGDAGSGVPRLRPSLRPAGRAAARALHRRRSARRADADGLLRLGGGLARADLRDRHRASRRRWRRGGSASTCAARWRGCGCWASSRTRWRTC